MFKKFITVLLTAAMVVTGMPQISFVSGNGYNMGLGSRVFANEDVSTGNGDYISEVRISTGSNESGPKQWLIDNDYTVIDQDLNGDTKEGYVYLGYKTTNNPDNALTDIKIMNMNGGYVIDESSAEVQNMKSEMSYFANETLKVIDKVRKNYNDGSIYAQAAVEGLNRYIYDDNGTLLGDWVINGNPSAEELKNVIFYTEPIVSTAFFQMLSLGLRGAGEQPFTEKAVEYIQDESKTYTEAEEDIAYDNIYQCIVDIADEYRRISEIWDTKGESALDESQILYIGKVDITFGTPLGDGTLLDYILNPNLSPEDVFPIAAAISWEQVFAGSYAGFMNAGIAATHNEESLKELTEFFSGVDKASVWEGIDKDAIDRPVAVTINAAREIQLDKSFMDTAIENGTAYSTGVGIVFGVAGGIVTGIAVSGFSRATAFAANAAARIETFDMMITSGFQFSRNVAMATMADTGAYVVNCRNLASAARTTATTMTKVAIALIAVAVVIVTVSVIVNVYDYYNPTLAAIPYFMMDATQNPFTGDNIYVTYRAVYDQDSEPGDLNSRDGRSWNAIYTTKDPRAGKPIRANMLYQANDVQTPDGYHPVAHFGEVVAADLNQGVFNTDTRHYLFVERNENHVSYLASVFGSTGGIILLLGIGLLLGGAGGTFITHHVYKRKRKTAYKKY